MNRFASVIVGAALIAGALYLGKQTLHFLHEGVPAVGLIVGERGKHEWSVGNRSGVSYSNTYDGIVEFTPAGGKPLRFDPKVWSSWHAKVGREVRVLYDRDDPHNAHVDAFFDNWGASLILGVLGAAFLLQGLGVLALRDDDRDDIGISSRWVD